MSYEMENRLKKDIAIRVEGLGKCYQIYNKPSARLLQMLVRGRKKFFQEFWALSDVSFTVRRGETLGIVGRNGSGKSTLLQMICGTLNPSLGGVTVHGKVAALLELGAGFNPEFSGRENVYMAASLYGLSRIEIDRRFDRIAAFADIGEHLEQPVKTYSSGMYVRLAFAVIAHVDADILVIDEALAVGDAVFTQKCMRFIRSFREKGTLLFVSHDMGSVLNLCQNAIWLHQGKIRLLGPAKLVAEEYLQYTLQEVYGEDATLKTVGESTALEPQLDADGASEHPSIQLAIDYASQMQINDNLNDANGWKSGAGEIRAVRLLHAGGNQESIYKGGEVVRLLIQAVAHQDMDRPILGFLVRDRLGQDLFGENTLPFTDIQPQPIKKGQQIEACYEFQLPMLPNGQYVVMASLADGDLYNNVQHHWMHDALVINVSSSLVRWGLVGIQFKKVTLQKIK